jgi:hypothetical protein
MSGLVNGVLAGTGAREICNRSGSIGELQQRDFFGRLHSNETDPTRLLEWFRWRLAFAAGIAGRGPRREGTES